MPRLKNLPSLDIINGFRGIVDFYLWKGLPVARLWPRNPKSHHSPATIAAAAVFGVILKNYHLLGGTLLDAFEADAADQTRTGRDIYVSAMLGNLHEVIMSDFETMLGECVTALQLIDDMQAALASIDTDRLQVNVKESSLPSGAATNAKLDEIIQALATGAPFTIPFVIDGALAEITDGEKGHIPIPFACTIHSCTMLANQSGSIVVDIWKDSYANFPPTVADTITAAAKPTISAAQKSQDTTLSGWDTDITAGDVLAFNVDSCTDIQRLTISLSVTKV